uniref:Uncharacterized protein n=1 Tax=Hordeum vulgare subsp. vulgare TaxID=112509 RepID=A0A8I6YAI2_HORVV
MCFETSVEHFHLSINIFCFSLSVVCHVVLKSHITPLLAFASGCIKVENIIISMQQKPITVHVKFPKHKNARKCTSLHPMSQKMLPRQAQMQVKGSIQTPYNSFSL